MLPNLTGKSSFSEAKCKLFALLAHLGGLALLIPHSILFFSFHFSCHHCFIGSVSFAALLCFSADVLLAQLEAKQHVVDDQCKSITDLHDSLLPSLSGEPGSSSWLTALPFLNMSLPYTRELFKMLCVLGIIWLASTFITIKLCLWKAIYC